MPKEELLLLARHICRLRQQKGLTQEALALRCGISVSFLSLLERGERSPSYETLIDMARGLDLSVAELFRHSPGDLHDDPYYARLVEFAGKHRINHGQVDRLLAVGHAMFGFSPEAQRAPVSGEAGRCSAGGCDRAPLARGLCALHYHRERRAKR